MSTVGRYLADIPENDGRNSQLDELPADERAVFQKLKGAALTTLRECKRSIVEDPTFIEPYIVMARLHYSADDVDSSRRVLHVARRLFPDEYIFKHLLTQIGDTEPALVKNRSPSPSKQRKSIFMDTSILTQVDQPRLEGVQRPHPLANRKTPSPMRDRPSPIKIQSQIVKENMHLFEKLTDIYEEKTMARSKSACEILKRHRHSKYCAHCKADPLHHNQHSDSPSPVNGRASPTRKQSAGVMLSPLSPSSPLNKSPLGNKSSSKKSIANANDPFRQRILTLQARIGGSAAKLAPDADGPMSENDLVALFHATKNAMKGSSDENRVFEMIAMAVEELENQGESYYGYEDMKEGIVEFAKMAGQQRR